SGADAIAAHVGVVRPGADVVVVARGVGGVVDSGPGKDARSSRRAADLRIADVQLAHVAARRAGDAGDRLARPVRLAGSLRDARVVEALGAVGAGACRCAELAGP